MVRRNVDPFDALTETWEPLLRKAFIDAVHRIRSDVSLSAIVRMLEAGDVDGAVRAVGIDPLKFQTLDVIIGQTFNAGGQAFGLVIPPMPLVGGATSQFVFSVRDTYAENWILDRSSTLIRQITADQTEMVRLHLLAGLEAGVNPRTMALDLVGRITPATGLRDGGVLGLTASQEAWQRRYAAELASTDPDDLKKALARGLRDKRFDAAIRKAIATGEPIPAAIRAKMVAAYRNRSLKYRADTIARTETLRALAASKTEAHRQAIARGHLKAEQITRFWKTAGDERVRHTHRLIPSMNKEGVGWEQPFQTPTGPSMHAPHDTDPQCRCREEVRIDYFAGLK